MRTALAGVVVGAAAAAAAAAALALAALSVISNYCSVTKTAPPFGLLVPLLYVELKSRKICCQHHPGHDCSISIFIEITCAPYLL